MKQLFFIILSFLCSITAEAQYSKYNSLERKAIVSYRQNSKGLFERQTNVPLDYVTDVTESYAYDKKTGSLYLFTPFSNVVVRLEKSYAKMVKKDKSIPKLKGEQLSAEIDRHTKFLDDRFGELNRSRQKFITDSLQKAYDDSVAAVRKREAELAAARKFREDYAKSHNPRWVPTKGYKLECPICENTFDRDSTFTLGIANDSIYFLAPVDGELDITYLDEHEAKLPDGLLNEAYFKLHYSIFKDSLTNDSTDYGYDAQIMHYLYLKDYTEKLRKEAPYGFINEWGWDSEYGNVSFHIEYVNTNPKTIKYITIYFKITNDVDDVRRVGYFRGTGPVEQWESGSWNWDDSYYYVAGDATSMTITKIVLTYMNGKTQVVTGRYLRFN